MLKCHQTHFLASRWGLGMTSLVPRLLPVSMLLHRDYKFTETSLKFSIDNETITVCIIHLPGTDEAGSFLCCISLGRSSSVPDWDQVWMNLNAAQQGMQAATISSGLTGSQWQRRKSAWGYVFIWRSIPWPITTHIFLCVITWYVYALCVPLGRLSLPLLVMCTHLHMYTHTHILLDLEDRLRYKLNILIENFRMGVQQTLHEIFDHQHTLQPPQISCNARDHCQLSTQHTATCGLTTALGGEAMAMELNATELASGVTEQRSNGDGQLEVEESNGTEFQLEVCESDVERQIDQCVIQLQTYAMIMTAPCCSKESQV